MKNTKNNTMKNVIAVTAAILILSISLLLTGCGEDTKNTNATEATQSAQATTATINKNETTATGITATETVKGTDPTTAKAETTAPEKATEAKSSSSSSSKSDSSSSSSKSSGGSGGSSSNSGSGSSGGGSSSKSSGGGSSTSSKSSSSAADPHAGKTYHEAVYENVWVVDQAACSYEEPVYEERQITVCHVCGAEFDTSYDTSTFYDHIINHELAGEGSGYHSDVRKIQTGTKTVNVPEEGHYEKKLVKEAGWY